MPVCEFCGEERVLEIFDIWASPGHRTDGDGNRVALGPHETSGGHEFQFETCCEGLHEAVVEQMDDDPEWGRELLRSLGAEDILGHELRRVASDGGCGMLLDWKLDIRPVRQKEAKALIRAFHRHNAPPAGWRFGAAIYNGMTMVGVVWVGRPVARGFDPVTTVEVNRLCIRTDLPPDLVWNACSQCYGWAAREAKKRGFEHIVTYTLESEAGTSLIAAGWEREAEVRGRSWNTPSRPRGDSGPTDDKVRWGKSLRKQRRGAAPAHTRQPLPAAA